MAAPSSSAGASHLMAVPVRRPRLLTVLALLVAGCGLAGCESEERTRQSVGMPAEGRYVGETSQGLPISFIVAGAAVRDLSFGWRARCDDGQVHANTIALPGGAIHYRVFSSGGPLETGGIAHVDGKFDGAQASGNLSRSEGSAFGTNCRATGINWSADLVPGTAPDDVSLSGRGDPLDGLLRFRA
jgi:hypothetical protein